MRILILIVIFFVLSGCVNAEQNESGSSDDFCKILQLTIDLPKLQQFFHVEKIQDRSPLRVAVNDVNVSCTLTKFDKKVVLFDKNTTYNQSVPFIEVLEIDISSNLATISIVYRVEGIKGTAKLRKNDSKWEVYRSHIVEM